MMKHAFITLIAMVLLTSFARAEAESALNPAAIVHIKYGDVVGTETKDNFVFKGLPYAAAPVGPLRFAAPREPAAWKTPFQADTFGDMCPQYEFVTKKVLGNEDCLKMNIWRPKHLAKPLPVMIFIPGGGNSIGTAAHDTFGYNVYDGTEIANTGVIVVTFNYRLGVLGFLAHKALERADGQVGNYAILDQLLALKFVHENIAAFGGDPKNVTVFGESAGGIDILVLLASPLSKGLLKRTIIESPFLNDLPKVQAEDRGEKIAASVGCDAKTEADVVNCLRSRPYDMLVTNFATSIDALLNAAGATDDGVVLKESVWDALTSGRALNVPVILGNNSEEFRTLAPFVVPKMGVVYTDKDYTRDLTNQFGASAAAKIEAYYPVKRYVAPRLALDAVMTDYFALCPARALTRAMLERNPQTYRYVFSHTSQNPLMAGLGAGHGMEMAYVFGTISHLAYTPAEFTLSKNMRTYWTQFAKTGNPNGSGLPMWPNVQGDLDLDLDTKIRSDVDYHGEACDFWSQLGVGNGVIF